MSSPFPPSTIQGEPCILSLHSFFPMPTVLCPVAEEMALDMIEDAESNRLNITEWRRRIEGDYLAQEISDAERDRMYQLLRRLDVQ